MKRAFAVTVAIALLCLSSIAQADVFNLGEGFTNLETVAVGDPGNAGDTRYGGSYGSVSYDYNIGKYEVTAKQYTDFLNNKAKSDPYGLYSADMWSSPTGCKIQQSGTSGNYSYTVADDYANRPVNFVNFWDSCRFANWLHNGQGNGDTETGAYTIPDGYTGDAGEGRAMQRNAGATWCVPSEDEWYKAAYYKGGGTNAGYWDYPMQSDISTTPSNDVLDPDPGNNANFAQDGSCIGGPYWRTPVGEFENSESAYGTFDQGGNVWECNEALIWWDDMYYRGLRGGSFDDYDYDLLASERFASWNANRSGFRVACIPEPPSIIALVGGLGSLLAFRRRRA